MIRFILSLFSPFRWFIEKLGADYNQFIVILKLKLTIDDRASKRIYNKEETIQGNSLMRQSITQIFIGGLFALFMNIIISPFTFYYIAHTWIMVMMAMMIISEFTTILFDTSENIIIQPLPVKGNTVSLARNAHVFCYLTIMAFNISLLTLILAIFKFGILAGLIFIFTIFLNVLFTLFLANILYLGIMRLATGEQLKNLLMYFQITIAILFMAGYQFGMKIIDTSVIRDLTVTIHWYTFLFPAAFFAGLIEAITSLNFDQQHLIFILESLAIPIAAIYFTGNFLTPLFNRKLMELEQGDRDTKVKSEVNRTRFWFRLMNIIFVTSNVEGAAFKLLWKMTGRERLFKQMLLPSFGYIIIMIVVPFFSRPVSFDTLISSDKYLLLLYAFLFVAATLPAALLNGNNKNAGWIFKTSPLNSPSELFKGYIKAAFARFFVPFYILVGIAVCSIWGIKVLPDVVIALLAIYLFTLIYYYSQYPAFPFTMEKIASNSGERMIKVFGIIVMAVVLGFLHKYLLGWHSYTNLLLLPFYVGAIIYVNRRMVYRKITWESVDKVNTYP
jgi:ABC-2 type transport system permease protein